MVYLTADLHLGHSTITKYRKDFKTAEEHDEFWLQKIEKLNKRDILIVFGDFIFDSDRYEEQIERLRNVACRIKVIMGNHDSLKLYNEPKDSSIEIQLPLYTYKGFWVSHCPIHPQEMRNRKGNIHGHLHHNVVDDLMYYSVCPEQHGYEFVTLDEVRKYYEVS
jgi:calcineurin-like phosphoesterase family protein